MGPKRGGFFPSAMGSILQSGPLFMTASVIQGRRLLQNEKERMASRKKRGATKKRRPKRSRKTLRRNA